MAEQSPWGPSTRGGAWPAFGALLRSRWKREISRLGLGRSVGQSEWGFISLEISAVGGGIDGPPL